MDMNFITMRLNLARLVPAALALGCASAFADVPTVWNARGPGAGGALYSPAISPHDDRVYYVACDMSELFHTEDFGESYGVVPATSVQGGHATAVQFTSDPLIAYTLSYTGGNSALPVKTIDGGATWTQLTDNPFDGDEIYSIWADPGATTRIILAGWNQIYLSNNGGASFSQINLAFSSADGVLVGGAFFDGAHIYLGTSAGLLVSTNGGTSFTNAGTPGIASGERILSFAGARAGGQMRFFCLTAAQSYPGIDLGSDYWENFRHIYSLENGSGTWTARNSGLNPATDFLLSVAMARNNIDVVYAAGGSDAGVPVVFRTTDAGASWTNTFLTDNNENIRTGWSGQGGDRGWGYGEVVFGLAVAPTNASNVIFTDYGFVHRTSDGGATWRQAYVSTADEHAAGATDIARRRYHSSGIENTSVWQVHWSDAQNMFGAYSDIRGTRSTDGGATWSFDYTGHDANTMYWMVEHPTTHTLYAATSGIHDLYQSTRLGDSPLNNADSQGKVIFSTDEGATWQLMHNFGHPVFWVALDPTSPNRLYASVVHSTAGGVFVSSNIQNGASASWTRLPAPPRTEGHPASITVLNDGKVVCTYSGRRASAFTASSGVFIHDPGTGGWSDVSDTGMRYWTRDLVLDPADSTQNTWYVGVFSGWGGPPNGLGGLYRTTDRGAHWTRINALDRVTSITFDPVNTGHAYLTTETDGLWHTTDVRAASPVFTRVASYPFRQPERVFFNPHQPAEVWVTSFGNGLRVGTSTTIGPPEIQTQPASQAVTAGSPLMLSVQASDSGALAYQWRLDGVAISGATGATYMLPSVQAFHAGTYSVVVTGAGGSVTSAGAVVTVGPAPASSARVMNLSTRGLALTGDNAMIPGFVISGSGTKRVLVRAAGPALLGSGLNGVLAQPVFTLKRYVGASHSYEDVAVGDAWSQSANAAGIADAAAAVGAFAFAPGSADAALLMDLAPGQYTAVALGKNGGTGLTLVEVYDADAGTPSALLANISNRGYVGTGSDVMIPGFVISEEGARVLLIRAVGPTLAASGVTDALADPQLAIYHHLTATNTDELILANDDWDGIAGSTTTAAVAAQVGAFPLPAGSKDAALVVTLAPGVYTVHVSGVGGAMGTALVEVYLVP